MTDTPGPRISVTERERALRELSHHLGTGRLTLDEFETRSAAVAAASGPAQLAAVFTDLPGAVPDPAPLTPPGNPVPAIAAAGVVTLGIVLALVFGSWWLLLLPILVGAAALIAVKRRSEARRTGI
ncbi:DUF1707 domain-containing protein [Nocardia cyriacigeorgica]|uniref:DUF1707 domain-containing protein n=1 Tax=Nocardia cyriacigeorgica TaxID=135487 RepID=UPI002457A2CE|nr:DUF1707 domain-containing protein [Nocardia cyriacigeorgica]